MNKAKAILFYPPGEVRVEEVEIPDPQAGEILVQTNHSCISPGTELRCLRGQQEGTQESDGFIAGYACGGTVIAAGPGTTLSEGTNVRYNGTQQASRRTQWGGHVSLAVMSQDSVQVIPEGVSTSDASVARLAGISYRGVALSNPLPHHRVVVIGLGPIGQLSARLHAITGAKVIGADVSEQRVKMLRDAGVEAVVVQGSLKESLAENLPQGADVVVDATGASPVMKEAISTIREMPWTPEPGPAPKYIIQGSYPGAVELPYQDFFMSETEVRIPRDCRPEELNGVLDLMARDKLKVSDLISEIARPDDAPGIYQRLQEQGTPLVTVVFEWQ